MSTYVWKTCLLAIFLEGGVEREVRELGDPLTGTDQTIRPTPSVNEFAERRR